jgi:hypothetical protein
MPIEVITIAAFVVVWLTLFAYWKPDSTLAKGLVLISVVVLGMTAVHWIPN